MLVLIRAASALTLLILLSGCSAVAPFFLGARSSTEEPGGDRFPDVLAVELIERGDRVYDVRVTMSSPYDTPERYADGWRVLDPAGAELGTHTLLHDHASEQPFTRTQQAVTIPEGVPAVTVQGRDRANGFGGLTQTVAVPES